MKFNLVILLLLGLVLCQVFAKTKNTKRTQDEENAEAEEGAEEGEEDGETADDDGISEDSLMEYRILGKGTFSVHNSQLVDDEFTLRGTFIQFPNYCKAQLNNHQFVALTAKATTYYECWKDAAEVTEIGSCRSQMTECSKDLKNYEIDQTPKDSEAEGAGAEEGAEDGTEDGTEEGTEAAPEDNAELNNIEQEDAPEGEVEEGAEGAEEGAGEGAEGAEGEGELSESSSEEDDDYILDDIPQLNRVQIACYYSAVTENLQLEADTIDSEEALLEQNVDQIFTEITFHAKCDRNAVSWLEFWLYMCNNNDEILDVFDNNDLLVSSEEAIELYGSFHDLVDENADAPAEDGADDIAQEPEQKKKVVKKAAKKQNMRQQKTQKVQKKSTLKSKLTKQKSKKF